MRYSKISLDDAVVVVTGGARGIGRATSEQFAARGATVCLGDLDGDAAVEAAAGMPRAHGYSLDVTQLDSYAAMVADVVDTVGRVDVLVNNAGIMPIGDFVDEPDATSRATLAVNVWGLIHGMRLVLPHMISRGRGHIVNVASMAGKIPVPGLAVYNASKFAAVGLSASVRAEYADAGVSVTAVLPSAVRTRLASGVPLGHGMPTVEPEDVAAAIVGSLRRRPAEITVPRYLAGWDLLDAAVPDPLMRFGRKLIGDRRALEEVDHTARADYERAIDSQSRTGD